VLNGLRGPAPAPGWPPVTSRPIRLPTGRSRPTRARIPWPLASSRSSTCTRSA